MNDATPIRADKLRSCRARKKDSGLREVGVWVPDFDAPDFWRRSVTAAAILRGAPEEEETMRFIEASQADDGVAWD